MAVRESMRPEALARERALAAARYRKQNIGIAVLAGIALAVLVALAGSYGEEGAVVGVLIVYALSIPIGGVALWLGAVLWWGQDCTLPVHVLRVAALNAVSYSALFACAAFGMPFIATIAIVMGLMVLILRGIFDLDGPESVVAALVLLFTPYVLAMLLAVL
jgi:hypothetical protein